MTIIDLDLKDFGRMGKWEVLDRNVVRCTLEAEEGVEEGENRVCIDDYASSLRAL